MAMGVVWNPIIEDQCTMKEFESSLDVRRHEYCGGFYFFEGFSDEDWAFEDFVPGLDRGGYRRLAQESSN